MHENYVCLLKCPISLFPDRNRFPLHSQEAEDAGFDEHYFRRRPKSFCLQPGGPPTQPMMPPMPGVSQHLPIRQQVPPSRSIYATIGGGHQQQAMPPQANL